MFHKLLTNFYFAKEPPKLSGPIMTDNSSFIFQCEVFYDARDSQGIEVVWTFNGQVDPDLGSHVISDSDKLIVLNGTALMGHLGTNVSYDEFVLLFLLLLLFCQHNFLCNLAVKV